MVPRSRWYTCCPRLIAFNRLPLIFFYLSLLFYGWRFTADFFPLTFNRLRFTPPGQRSSQSVVGAGLQGYRLPAGFRRCQARHGDHPAWDRERCYQAYHGKRHLFVDFMRGLDAGLVPFSHPWEGHTFCTQQHWPWVCVRICSTHVPFNCRLRKSERPPCVWFHDGLFGTSTLVVTVWVVLLETKRHKWRRKPL